MTEKEFPTGARGFPGKTEPNTPTTIEGIARGTLVWELTYGKVQKPKPTTPVKPKRS